MPTIQKRREKLIAIGIVGATLLARLTIASVDRTPIGQERMERITERTGIKNLKGCTAEGCHLMRPKPSPPLTQKPSKRTFHGCDWCHEDIFNK